MSNFSNRSVLDVCEQLHMIANGSLMTSPEHAGELFYWLNTKLHNWSSGPKNSAFDDIVKALAEEALDEYQQYYGMLTSFNEDVASEAKLRASDAPEDIAYIEQLDRELAADEAFWVAQQVKV